MPQSSVSEIYDVAAVKSAGSEMRETSYVAECGIVLAVSRDILSVVTALLKVPSEINSTQALDRQGRDN